MLVHCLKKDKTHTKKTFRYLFSKLLNTNTNLLMLHEHTNFTMKSQCKIMNFLEKKFVSGVAVVIIVIIIVVVVIIKT